MSLLDAITSRLNADRQVQEGNRDIAWTMAKNAAMQIPAGYSGLLELLRTGDLGMAADEVNTRKAAVGEGPSTEAGRQQQQNIAGLVQKAGDIPLPSGHTVSQTLAPAAQRLEQFQNENPAMAAAGMGLLTVADPTKGKLKATTAPAFMSREAIDAARKTFAEQRNAHMSKAQSKALGYEPDVAVGAKAQRPYDQMTSTHEAIPGVIPDEIPTITPEAIVARGRGGKAPVILPATGDPSRAGSYLTSVNGQELTQPVMMAGGARFGHLTGGDAWANAVNEARAIGDVIRKMGQEGRDVLMSHVSMGPASLDSSTMTWQTMADLMRQSNISPKAKAAFDAEARKAFPGFPGLDDPHLDNVMLDPNARLGAKRAGIVQQMAKPGWYDEGFPDIAAIRKALTEPQLLNTPLHTTGLNVMQMDPAGVVTEGAARGFAHPGYPANIGGVPLGQADKLRPRADWFQDFERDVASKKTKRAGDRSFMINSPRSIVQVADQEWLDNLRRAEEMRAKAGVP